MCRSGSIVDDAVVLMEVMLVGAVVAAEEVGVAEIKVELELVNVVLTVADRLITLKI